MPDIEISLDQLRPRSRLRDSQTLGQSNDLVDPSGAKRVGISTLGCKVNTYESELIGEALRADQWQLVGNDRQADLYLINTCTVTKEADRQARQQVRKVIKQNPDALVIVTGCYAQMDPTACAEIPGVDLVLGNDQKLDVHKLLPQLQRGELPRVMVGDLDQHVSLPDQLLAGFEAQTRAFVQIQQGCDQGCTFCIIHVARGPSRSLAPSLIKRQVQRLVLNGYPEIVICGVDLGSYGEDFSHNELAGEPFNLVQLLEELLALDYDVDNPFRLRLSSVDPHHITDDLIDLMAREPRLCPNLHLSLQSGSTLILKRMKRRYDAEHVRSRIEALRARVPDLVMSADVMVGFPTETETQYLETEQMVRDIDIAFPHVFSYSERDGTPAARIPSSKQVPVAERKTRNQRLREVGQQLAAALRDRSIGKRVWLLPEKAAKREGFAMCRAEDYQTVLVPLSQVKLGHWQYCIIDRVEQDILIAQSFTE